MVGALVVRSERADDVQVVALSGELDLDGAPRLEQALLAAETSDAAAIVVDLSALEFIDSTGIRLLLVAADRCRESERLTIVPGPKQVQRVFEITDLVHRLPFVGV